MTFLLLGAQRLPVRAASLEKVYDGLVNLIIVLRIGFAPVVMITLK